MLNKLQIANHLQDTGFKRTLDGVFSRSVGENKIEVQLRGKRGLLISHILLDEDYCIITHDEERILCTSTEDAIDFLSFN